MTSTLTINGDALSFAALAPALAGPIDIAIGARAMAAVEDGHTALTSALATGKALYGVNTGFGKLASTRINDADLTNLQRNIVRSHAAGTGEPLDDGVVRLILTLKTASLARGYSGVRPALISALTGLLSADVLPVIPSQGSVGASGDLAPLAHLALVLIGEGEAKVAGRVVPGAEALAAAGVAPVTLAPKEGLALLNGTQVSTALALAGLDDAFITFRAALVAGAMSCDAVRASDTPFDPRIHVVRGHQGQMDTAAALRELLSGSEIRASHRECDHVQDPYSFRCQPQVMGACLDLLRQAASTLVIEANAVTDNPLVFAADHDAEVEVLSGGNFHAEPVAFVADILALAIAEIGALSERRMAALIDPVISGQPPFLTSQPGLMSGYMMAQVTAAALASETKQLAHPASVDSLPTSANQEDHVSMATHAGVRLGRMNANVRGIVAIELLAAAEGIDFLRPLRSSGPLEEAHTAIRAQIPRRDEDRVFAPDIEAARALIAEGAVSSLVSKVVVDS